MQSTIDHSRFRLKHTLRAAWRPTHLPEIVLRAVTVDSARDLEVGKSFR